VKTALFADGQEEWNQFVAETPAATLFHDLRWRGVIEDTFGLRAHYLEVRDEGRLAGVLPMFQVPLPVARSALISLPFLNYGGPLARTPEARQAVLAHAEGLADRLGVRYLELRAREPLGSRFATSGHKETYEVALDAGAEGVWKALNSSVRNKVRKAAKSGVAVRTGLDLLPRFYECYAHNMRDLGTPVVGQGFFERIAAAFPEESEVLVAEHEGRAVGGKFVMMQRGVMYFIWASSVREALRLAPNDALNWCGIELACERGLESCDFGRSTRGSSHAAYKQQWATQPRPLYWERYSPDGRPDAAPLRENRPVYRLASACWQRLPLPVANRLGPFLSRYLP